MSKRELEELRAAAQLAELTIADLEAKADKRKQEKDATRRDAQKNILKFLEVVSKYYKT